MRNKNHCTVGSKCWGIRHEILGLIIIIIAAFLTIGTLSGLGILGMFISGVGLYCYKSVGHCNCHCHHDDCCGDDEDSTHRRARHKK